MSPALARNPTPEEPRQTGPSRNSQQQEPLTRELTRLIEHSLWANRQWIEFVFAQPDPESRPRELLGHLMISERIWFERIAGEKKTRSMFPRLSREELLGGLDENRQAFLTLIPTHLEDIIEFTRATGVQYRARVIDIIHHLLTHGYHHRGQLAAHYARRGVTYPNTDHINYLVENRL
jgi:uncharacterized damage-inducible protein DinB